MSGTHISVALVYYPYKDSKLLHVESPGFGNQFVSTYYIKRKLNFWNWQSLNDVQCARLSHNDKTISHSYKMWSWMNKCDHRKMVHVWTAWREAHIEECFPAVWLHGLWESTELLEEEHQVSPLLIIHFIVCQPRKQCLQELFILLWKEQNTLVNNSCEISVTSDKI